MVSRTAIQAAMTAKAHHDFGVEKEPVPKGMDAVWKKYMKKDIHGWAHIRRDGTTLQAAGAAHSDSVQGKLE